MGSGSGGGGLIGSAVKIGTLGAVDPGGRGWLGDITGANQAADAAQAAANAQAEMAGQTRAEILAYAARTEKEAMEMAAPSDGEIANTQRLLGASESALARQERMLAAIDPALMEASSQALKLLRGESINANKPQTALRNSQRQQLVSSLRAQYGPGAELSSIGQSRLSQFDMETNAMEQQQLGQLFGMATHDAGAGLRSSIGQLQQVGQGWSALRDRQLNTRMNLGSQTLGALSGTSQQMINSAGAPYVGAAVQAQGQQALFNQAVGIGGMALGNYMGGAGLASSMGGGGGAMKAQVMPANYAGGGNLYGNMA